MNSKILVKDYASLMEYRLSKDNAEMTCLLHQASIVVNPYYSSLFNKTVIINLPIEVPLDRLMQFNKIISRFPIGYGIKVEPYDLPDDREDISKEDFSCLILNKNMLIDLDYAELVDTGKFLIGIDAMIDGEITLVGYILLKNKLENLMQEV